MLFFMIFLHTHRHTGINSYLSSVVRHRKDPSAPFLAFHRHSLDSFLLNHFVNLCLCTYTFICLSSVGHLNSYFAYFFIAIITIFLFALLLLLLLLLLCLFCISVTAFYSYFIAAINKRFHVSQVNLYSLLLLLSFF